MSANFAVKTLIVGPFMQNCRLIYDKESFKALIVDPGDDAEEILKAVSDLRLEVKAILLTHGHVDHAGACAALQKALSLKIIGPAAEDDYLIDDLNAQCRAFGLPPTAEIIDKPRYVGDGEHLDLLPGLTIEVLKTPGHTPGGVCFYLKEADIVLTGDTLFYGSVGRTDFPKGSFEDLHRSILNKLYALPPKTEVLCGHGPNSSLDFEMEHNPYVNLHDC